MRWFGFKIAMVGFYILVFISIFMLLYAVNEFFTDTRGRERLRLRVTARARAVQTLERCIDIIEMFTTWMSCLAWYIGCV